MRWKTGEYLQVKAEEGVVSSFPGVDEHVEGKAVFQETSAGLETQVSNIQVR